VCHVIWPGMPPQVRPRPTPPLYHRRCGSRHDV
jgi:hypothetical protein